MCRLPGHTSNAETVQVPPPLSLSLLADQPAQCPSCKEEVQLKNINKHMSSGCTLHTHVTIQHILQKPLDAPLTKLEENMAICVATWRGVGGEEDGEEKGKKGEKDKGKRG